MAKKSSAPWIVAHRGARDEAPENTYTAFKQALRYDVDGIEFDVQMSSDGVLVLYHDRTLFKVNRSRRRVSDLTVKSLEHIDWGGWYDSRFSGEPLATLEGALSILDRCPRILLEIKSRPVDQVSGRSSVLAEKVIACVNQSKFKALKERILVLSFDPHILAHAYEMDPDLRYVLNISKKEPINSVEAHSYLWAIGMRISRLSYQYTQWAHDRNLKVFTYTCNGPRQVKKALRMGVDGIITDRPRWLAKSLEDSRSFVVEGSQ